MTLWYRRLCIFSAISAILYNLTYMNLDSVQVILTICLAITMCVAVLIWAATTLGLIVDEIRIGKEYANYSVVFRYPYVIPFLIFLEMHTVAYYNESHESWFTTVLLILCVGNVISTILHHMRAKW